MILEESEPELIVVSNTKARQFLGKDANHDNDTNVWLGYQFKFDNIIGTHVISNQDSKLFGTPVFFSSMLTGQRALDNGSFERLVWQLETALKFNTLYKENFQSLKNQIKAMQTKYEELSEIKKQSVQKGEYGGASIKRDQQTALLDDLMGFFLRLL